MVTVKEFIEWLKHFPDDAIVKVAVEQCYGGDSVQFEDIDIKKYKTKEGWDIKNNSASDGWEIRDYTIEKGIQKHDKRYNKKILYLGEKF